MATPTHEALFEYHKGGGYDAHPRTKIGSLNKIPLNDPDSQEFAIGLVKNNHTCLVAKVPAEMLGGLEEDNSLKIDMYSPIGTVEEVEINASDIVFWIGFSKNND